MSTLGTTSESAAVASVVLAHLEAAWNRADGAGFGEAFADQADFVDIRGEHHQGSGDLIGHGHQAIFDTIYRGSTVRYELDSARPLGDTAILAVATATLDAPDGPLAGRHRSRLTLVITSAHGRWEVAAFHNTLVAEAA